jgi:protein TonB
VAPDGSVLEARVEGSSGFPRLDGAALEAIRRWRFLPALDGEGRPVAGEALVPFRFALEP